MAASLGAWSKPVKGRVTPEPPGLVLPMLKAVLGPKMESRTVAAAPLKVLWPLTYSGNGGVLISGRQEGSAERPGLPPPALMAVMGRQKLKAYLASQATMAASPIATFSSASIRVVSAKLRFFDAASELAIM